VKIVWMCTEKVGNRGEELKDRIEGVSRWKARGEDVLSKGKGDCGEGV